VDDLYITSDEVVKAALRLCGIFDPDEDPSATEILNATEALNMMLKAWQTKGHLFSVADCVLFFRQTQYNPLYGRVYSLGGSLDPAGTTHFVRPATVHNYLNAAAAIGDTDITVYWNDTITVGHEVGIVSDSNTIQWRTISAHTPGTWVLTIDSPLTIASANGNAVFFHSSTARMPRPLKVYEAWYHTGPYPHTATRLTAVSEEEFKSISQRDTFGTPQVYWYDPQVRDTGYFYLWPLPTQVRDYVKILCQFRTPALTAGTDRPFFPIEWFEALKYNLAVRLAPEFGVPVEERAWLKAEAQQYLAEAESWHDEDTPTYIQPQQR
jgi:hypothetical protein